MLGACTSVSRDEELKSRMRRCHEALMSLVAVALLMSLEEFFLGDFQQKRQCMTQDWTASAILQNALCCARHSLYGV